MTNTPREPDASRFARARRSIRQAANLHRVARPGGGDPDRWLAGLEGYFGERPEITITFKTAEGLEAGKTKIKCKDVEVGLVEDDRPQQGFVPGMVKAQMVKGADEYLTENSRFWVVRARVSASSVTGLGTVFSGAYIDIDPGAPGKQARHLKDWRSPPS